MKVLLALVACAAFGVVWAVCALGALVLFSRCSQHVQNAVKLVLLVLLCLSGDDFWCMLHGFAVE